MLSIQYKIRRAFNFDTQHQFDVLVGPYYWDLNYHK